MARPDPGLVLDAVLRTFSTIGQPVVKKDRLTEPSNFRYDIPQAAALQCLVFYDAWREALTVLLSVDNYLTVVVVAILLSSGFVFSTLSFLSDRCRIPRQRQLHFP